MIFFFKKHDNPGYLPTMLCLWSQAGPWELHLAAINGGVVPNFTTKHKALSLKLQGQYHSASAGSAKFVINEDIYHHPPKKFGNEDREMVVILVGACGAKQYVHDTEILALKKYIVKDQH